MVLYGVDGIGSQNMLGSWTMDPKLKFMKDENSLW